MACPFNEGGGQRLTDLSLSRLTVTGNNNPPFLPGRHEGKAIDLTAASSQYLDFGDPSVVDFAAGDFTVSAWVYVKNLSANILVKDNGTFNSTNRQFNFSLGGYKVPSGGLGMIIFGAPPNNYAVPVTAGSLISTGNWYHVAWQRSGSSAFFYVNGVRFTGTFDTTDGAAIGSFPSMQSTTTNMQSCRSSPTSSTYSDARFENLLVHNIAVPQRLIHQLFVNPWVMYARRVAIRSIADSNVNPTGTGTPSLPAMTLSGTGIASHPGSGTPSLPAITASGTGIAAHTSTGAATLPAITASGTGIAAHKATGAVALPAIVASGTGVSSHPGTGTIALPAIVASGTGISTHVSTGAFSLPAITMSGIGIAAASGAAVGTGSLSLPAMTSSGTGVAGASPGSGRREIKSLGPARTTKQIGPIRTIRWIGGN